MSNYGLLGGFRNLIKRPGMSTTIRIIKHRRLMGQLVIVRDSN